MFCRIAALGLLAFLLLALADSSRSNRVLCADVGGQAVSGSAAGSATVASKAESNSPAETAKDRERAILDALNKTVAVDAHDDSLKSVIEPLAAKIDIQVVYDQKVLRDAGIAIDELQVSLQVRDISARSALRILLSQQGMDWAIRDEVLWISTQEVLETWVRVVVYDVADLVEPENAEESGIDPHALINIITGTVGTQTWSELGGIGMIESIGAGNRAALVVSQTRQVHEDIAQLLADLRATRNLQAERQGSAKSTHAELPQSEHKPAVEATKPATTSSILPPAEMKPVSSAVRRQMASANNQFACDLYARVAKQEGNVAFSPLCINMAMGMAYAGAKGQTADEIAKALHFSAGQHELHDALAAMRQGLAAGRSDRGVLLKFANRFWPKEGHGFESQFTELLRTKYAADVRPIDVHQPEAAAEAINQWFSMQTMGEFPALVRADFINDDTALVLTSAVSFHGTWETPFHISATKPQQFLGFNGKNEAPMMNQLDEVARFAKVGDVQLLEKRYAGSTLAMTILLPEKGTDAFANLTSRLTSEQFAAWFRQLETRSVRIAMPKFRLVANLPLKECLESLGVKRAFQPPGSDASADLSGMDGTGQLYFSDALHQAVVEVDEVGTKASAGTAVGGTFGGRVDPPPVFRADHPFVFVIRDTRTGCILFMGHFKRPTGSPS